MAQQSAAMDESRAHVAAAEKTALDKVQLEVEAATATVRQESLVAMTEQETEMKNHAETRLLALQEQLDTQSEEASAAATQAAAEAQALKEQLAAAEAAMKSSGEESGDTGSSKYEALLQAQKDAASDMEEVLQQERQARAHESRQQRSRKASKT